MSSRLTTLSKRHCGTKTRTIDIPKLKLRNGINMPQFALGTWKSPPGVTQKAVETAILNGCRNIDCANDYNNEPEVGQALANMISSGIVKRDELFIQIKLWNSNHRIEHIRPDLDASLSDLMLDYVDSYIIHWPQAVPSTGIKPAIRESGACPAHHSKHTMFPLDDNGYLCADTDSHFLETYWHMEDLIDTGVVRSIGLSNFNKAQIEEVLQNCHKYKPCILQNECHPYLQQKDLIDYCSINGIVFQAFSALGSGDTNSAVTQSPSGFIPLKDPFIQSLAEKWNKEPAQIILRWHAQRGYAFVSKSVTPSRIISNIEVFDWELSEEEMKSFDSINYWWRHLFWRETSNHEDYPFFDELPYKYALEKAPLESSSGTISE